MEAVHLPRLLSREFAISTSEARRSLAQGGVFLNDEPVRDLDVPEERLTGKTLRLGKSRSVILGGETTEEKNVSDTTHEIPATGSAAAARLASPPVDNEGGYFIFEVLAAADFKAAIDAGRVPPETEVWVKRGLRVGEESRDDAINAQAAEDDREGARYAATTARYLLEKTPQKDVRVTWK